MRGLLIQTGLGSQEDSIPVLLASTILRLRRIACAFLRLAQLRYWNFGRDWLAKKLQ